MTATVLPSANLKISLNVASKEFFQVALVTYLLLTLAETLQEGFVSNFFNLNYLLAVVLAAGVIMVLTEPAEGGLKQAAVQAGEEITRFTRTVARTAVRPAVDTFRRTTRPSAIDLRQVQVTPPPTHVAVVPDLPPAAPPVVAPPAATPTPSHQRYRRKVHL